MPRKGEIVKIDSGDVEDIRQAAIEFGDLVGKGLKGLKGLKDMHAEVKEWRIKIESQEEGITIDISVKLLIKPKSS